jgi:hypothetical protein
MYLDIFLRDIWPNDLAHFGYNFAEFLTACMIRVVSKVVQLIGTSQIKHL